MKQRSLTHASYVWRSQRRKWSMRFSIKRAGSGFHFSSSSGLIQDRLGLSRSPRSPSKELTQSTEFALGLCRKTELFNQELRGVHTGPQ